MGEGVTLILGVHFRPQVAFECGQFAFVDTLRDPHTGTALRLGFRTCACEEIKAQETHQKCETEGGEYILSDHGHSLRAKLCRACIKGAHRDLGETKWARRTAQLEPRSVVPS